MSRKGVSGWGTSATAPAGSTPATCSPALCTFHVSLFLGCCCSSAVELSGSLILTVAFWMNEPQPVHPCHDSLEDLNADKKAHHLYIWQELLFDQVFTLHYNYSSCFMVGGNQHRGALPTRTVLECRPEQRLMLAEAKMSPNQHVCSFFKFYGLWPSFAWFHFMWWFIHYIFI